MGLPSCGCVPPDGEDWSAPWVRECDYHQGLRVGLQVALGALADISDIGRDMTLAMARKKAGRIYYQLVEAKCTTQPPKDSKPSSAG